MDVNAQGSDQTTVTVAICTWNRARLLAQTLEQFGSLRMSSSIRWELLIIDNNSTDDTAAVAKQFENRLPLRYVFEPAPGLSNARNRALDEAAGRFVLFTDDDVLIDSDWVSAALATWQRFPKAAIVGGRIEPWFPTVPDPILLKVFPVFASGYCGLDHGSDERELASDQNVYGANFGVRRAAVPDLRFSVRFGPTAGKMINGDELDFIERARNRGGTVAWSPKMRVKHFVDPSRMTLDYIQRYYFDHARYLVRRDGLPGRARMGGAPLWLWRQALVTFGKLCAARFLSSREQRLHLLRDHTVSRGMLVEACSGPRRLHSSH